METHPWCTDPSCLNAEVMMLVGEEHKFVPCPRCVTLYRDDEGFTDWTFQPDMAAALLCCMFNMVAGDWNYGVHAVHPHKGISFSRYTEGQFITYQDETTYFWEF